MEGSIPNLVASYCLPDQWAADRLLHIQMIDQQQRTITELLSALRAVCGSQRKDLIPVTFDYLIEELRDHFDYEEGLMRIIAYPGREQHEQLHGDCLGRLATLCTDASEGTLQISTLMCDLLRKWLEEHVEEEDRDYCRYVAPLKGSPS